MCPHEQPDESFGAIDSFDALVIDAFDAAPYELDLRSGTLRPSPRLNALLGFPPNYTLSVADGTARIHPDDRAVMDQAVAEAISSGTNRFQCEYRVRLLDGTLRWLLSRGQVVVDARGQPICVRGAVIDISERQRAEQALRESEELFRQMADTLPQMLWATDAQGQVGFLNRRWYEYSGTPKVPITAAEVAANSVHPDDGPKLMAAFGEALRTGTGFEVEQRNRAASGEYRWFLNRAAPYRDPQTGAITRWFGVGIDIDDRKRLEEALRASEERYRTLLDRINQGFCRIEMLYDAQGEPVDYRFLEVNHSFERHTGLHNVVGKTARELVPELEPFWFATYGRVAARGEPLRFEQGSLAMGRLFEVEAVRVGPAERREVALVFTDVTERRQNQLKLAAAAARDQYLVRLADALRPLSNAVLIETTATRVLGEHLGANRVAYFEVDGDDYVAERYYSNGVVSPTGRFPSSSFGPTQLATYQAGRPVVDPDVVANLDLTPAEQAVYATYQIAAHVGIPLVKDGRFVAGLVVHQTTRRSWTADEVALITETAERTWAAIERARAEARLQELYAQEQAARKAAEEASRVKDDFLATLSHELRTPLTALLGYSELLLRRRRDEAYVARAVTKIVQSAKAQVALIEDLLDMSRIVSGKLRIEMAPTNLVDVIQAAVDTVLPSVEARQQSIQLALDPTASAVVGDANRLQQVVWNLLSNAAKFSPAGATITVELARVGDEAALAVSDTGQGIDRAFLPYVFDRFRQADSTSQRAHGGLGLGLAIVRHLVELHGGGVDVASAGTNQGATFTVRLPLALAIRPAEWRQAADVTPANGSQPLRGLRILVVDDQPAVLELLEELLVADGATVQGCGSAREALALLERWQPDLLLSDIAMPGEDGYWLIEQVRRRPATDGGVLPAVALTAYVRLEDRLRVLAAGFQQYVTKPVEADELRTIILHLVHTDQAL